MQTVKFTITVKDSTVDTTMLASSLGNVLISTAVGKGADATVNCSPAAVVDRVLADSVSPLAVSNDFQTALASNTLVASVVVDATSAPMAAS
jgi:hypothetical protein